MSCRAGSDLSSDPGRTGESGHGAETDEPGVVTLPVRRASVQEFPRPAGTAMRDSSERDGLRFPALPWPAGSKSRPTPAPGTEGRHANVLRMSRRAQRVGTTVASGVLLDALVRQHAPGSRHQRRRSRRRRDRAAIDVERRDLRLGLTHAKLACGENERDVPTIAAV